MTVALLTKSSRAKIVIIHTPSFIFYFVLLLTLVGEQFPSIWHKSTFETPRSVCQAVAISCARIHTHTQRDWIDLRNYQLISSQPAVFPSLWHIYSPPEPQSSPRGPVAPFAQRLVEILFEIPGRADFLKMYLLPGKPRGTLLSVAFPRFCAAAAPAATWLARAGWLPKSPVGAVWGWTHSETLSVHSSLCNSGSSTETVAVFAGSDQRPLCLTIEWGLSPLSTLAELNTNIWL